MVAAQVGLLERLQRLLPPTTPTYLDRDKHLTTEMSDLGPTFKINSTCTAGRVSSEKAHNVIFQEAVYQACLSDEPLKDYQCRMKPYITSLHLNF